MSDEISGDFFEVPSETPNVPEPVTDIPEISEVPEVPEIPDIPEEPEVIQEPEIPEEIEVPEEPEVIEEPDVNEEPDTVDDPQVQQAVDAIGSIENLNPATWDSLSPDERVATLQNIEDRMAGIQGRPAVEIYVDDTLEPNTFGGYDPETGTITVNASHLDSDMPVDEFIDTIVHEGRHAYQDYAVKNPGVHADAEQVNSWAENMQPGNYLRPEDYGQEIYEHQPVEDDAWNYATHIRNTLIANNWGK